MTSSTYVGERCECAICADTADATRTASCHECGGAMHNVQVGVYYARSGTVTSNGDIWTADHGWSLCEDCGSLGGYIQRGEEEQSS